MYSKVKLATTVLLAGMMVLFLCNKVHSQDPPEPEVTEVCYEVSEETLAAIDSVLEGVNMHRSDPISRNRWLLSIAVDAVTKAALDAISVRAQINLDRKLREFEVEMVDKFPPPTTTTTTLDTTTTTVPTPTTTTTTLIEGICGDGVKNIGETCDAGSSNCTELGLCNDDCTGIVTCGDNVIECVEVCDDGNSTDGDGCSSSCLPE
jgi:cysteine-rich repeat protein